MDIDVPSIGVRADKDASPLANALFVLESLILDHLIHSTSIHNVSSNVRDGLVARSTQNLTVLHIRNDTASIDGSILVFDAPNSEQIARLP